MEEIGVDFVFTNYDVAICKLVDACKNGDVKLIRDASRIMNNRIGSVLTAHLTSILIKHNHCHLIYPICNIDQTMLISDLEDLLIGACINKNKKVIYALYDELYKMSKHVYINMTIIRSIDCLYSHKEYHLLVCVFDAKIFPNFYYSEEYESILKKYENSLHELAH